MSTLPHRVSFHPAAWDTLLSRRDLLRGAVGISACLLPGASVQASSSGTARSVILLWMAGGVTHIDTFDPKPEAPAEIRGTLTAIDTNVPGIRFCETLPELARQAHHLAVVRGYSHDSNDHFLSQAFALCGRKVTMARLTAEPNVGSVVARVLGPRQGLPGYLAVPGTTRPGPPPKNLFTAGWLGNEHAPFCTGGTPRNEDFTARVAEASEEEFNMQALSLAAGLDGGRLAGRQALQQQLEASLRQIEQSGAEEVLARQFQGAFRMLTAPGVRRAFDLTQETADARDRYGRTKIGQRCLLARRLVEAGARFVMVDYGYDPEFGNLWDNHCAPVQNQPPIVEMVKRPYHVAGIDRAFAALLADLHERGRLAETLVVFLTEFGRTPQINKLGGRDHWGAAGSIFFAGGGTRGGQVSGATDRQAAQPTGNRYSPADVAATIYQAIGIETSALLHDRQSRPQAVLSEGDAIPGIL